MKDYSRHTKSFEPPLGVPRLVDLASLEQGGAGVLDPLQGAELLAGVGEAQQGGDQSRGPRPFGFPSFGPDLGDPFGHFRALRQAAAVAPAGGETGVLVGVVEAG